MSSRGSSNPRRRSANSSNTRRLASPRSDGRLHSGFPSSLTRIMRYHTAVSLAPGGAPAVHQFRLNSLFDPDYTGVGHQPLGYDQLTALYAQWWVTRAQVTVRATMMTTAADTLSLVSATVAAYAVANDTTVPSSLDMMLENHRPQYSLMTGYVQVAKVLHLNVHLPTLFGITEAQYIADDALGGASTSNPVRWGILNVAAGPTIGGTDTLSTAVVHVDVLIDFTAVWKGPLTLSLS